MSALASPAAAARPKLSRPGLVRLTGVELRKMVDTRAGLWLLIATAGLTLAAVVIVCAAGHADEQTFPQMLEVALAPSSVLLPIVGILLVTSEWTQRTAMITFALVPHRGRVIAAKLLAGLVLSAAAYLLCVAVAGVAVAVVSPDVDHVWSISAGLLLQDLLSVSIGMATGIGFGAVLLASAPAIVLYFVLPMAVGVLGAFSFFEGIAKWVDQTDTLSPLTSHLLSGDEWAKALVSIAIWTLVPLIAGAWRISREELR